MQIYLTRTSDKVLSKYNIKIMIFLQTLSSIKNNPGGVLAFDFGTVRRKKRKSANKFQLPSDIQSTPRISFVTGKRLQAVDFG